MGSCNEWGDGAQGTKSTCGRACGGCCGRGVDEGNHKENSLYDGEYSEVGYLMNHDAS